MHKQHVKYTIVKTHCIACLLVLKTENNSMNNKHDIQKLYKFFSLKHYYQYLVFFVIIIFICIYKGYTPWIHGSSIRNNSICQKQNVNPKSNCLRVKLLNIHVELLNIHVELHNIKHLIKFHISWHLYLGRCHITSFDSQYYSVHEILGSHNEWCGTVQLKWNKISDKWKKKLLCSF